MFAKASACPNHQGRLLRTGPVLAALLCVLMLLWWHSGAYAVGEKPVLELIGTRDALVLAGPDNRILLQKNARTPLVPASTLKLLSALAVMDALGADYRFETRFYTAGDGAIRVKGFGDPLLISEVVADMAAQVSRAARREGKRIHSLYADDTYFTRPIVIPGVTASSEPYDAPVGALCVNFNTVNYRIEDAKVLSAEPQTPLLPFAEALIRRHGKGPGGRIVLAHDNHAIALYGAHLFAHFLNEHPTANIDRVAMAPANQPAGKRLLVCRSPFSLDQLVEKMMAFSNNFVANQLVIAAGAKKYGAPGTLEKGVRLLEAYGRHTLSIENFTLVEGSGVSRQNRFTALALLRVVAAFEPHHHLLRHKNGEYYKTGTLKGVRARVGYLRRPAGGLYRFVIVSNTPGKSAARIKQALGDYLIRNGYP